MLKLSNLWNHPNLIFAFSKELTIMTRVFVGNLPNDIKEKELDDLFYK